ELSYRYPGDKVTIAYLRDDKTATATVTLVNTEGTTEIIKRNIVESKMLGAHLESTQYGVKVFRIQDNSVLKELRVPENFTIIAINRMRVKEPQDVIDFFTKYRGSGRIYGMNTSRQQLEIPFSIR